MAYSTTTLAKSAVDNLYNSLIRGLRVNSFDQYTGEGTATGDMLRRDFIRDEDYIRGALNDATNAAFDVQRAQAIQDAMNAEDINYANTRNAIAEMRRNLVGSGSSGANVGAANAAALQALLGLGQQNTQTTTEGLRNVNNVSRERAAQIAQNAVDAINTANEATKAMHDVGTSVYNSDRSYAAQGAAEALGNAAAASDTAASNERQTAETNAANKAMNERTAKATEEAAKRSANQKVTYAGGYKVK